MKNLNKSILVLIIVMLFAFAGFVACTSQGEQETEKPTATELPIETPEAMTETVVPATEPPTEELNLTLAELTNYNGENGNPAYVAYDGTIYDVTDIPEWAAGLHNGVTAGTDITESMKNAPHGTSKLDGLTVVGKIVE